MRATLLPCTLPPCCPAAQVSLVRAPGEAREQQRYSYLFYL